MIVGDWVSRARRSVTRVGGVIWASAVARFTQTTTRTGNSHWAVRTYILVTELNWTSKQAIGTQSNWEWWAVESFKSGGPAIKSPRSLLNFAAGASVTRVSHTTTKEKKTSPKLSHKSDPSARLGAGCAANHQLNVDMRSAVDGPKWGIRLAHPVLW